MKKIIFFVVIFCFNFLNSFSPIRDYRLFKAYKNNDYELVKDILQDMQIEKPTDSVINYNLGIVTYRLGDFESSKINFDRAAENSDKNMNLKERSFFNSANSFYKNCLSFLGEDWEQKDLPDDLLIKSIDEAKNSIKRYENALIINSKNKNTEDNLKRSKELLNKLYKKQKDKQQEEKQKDRQQEEKQKDRQNDKPEDGDNDNNKRKNEKHDGEDGDGKNKHENKEEQDSDGLQDNKNQQNQKDDDGQNEKNQEELGDKQSEGSHGEEDIKNKEEQAPGSNSKDGEPLQENEEKELAQSNPVQARKDEGDVDMIGHAMREMLTNLQEDEAKLQRQLIKKRVSIGNRLNKGQKPW